MNEFIIPGMAKHPIVVRALQNVDRPAPPRGGWRPLRVSEVERYDPLPARSRRITIIPNKEEA